ncbi:hypothetical protein HMPREF1316_2009 [Olsenella profusa F0195]|uniref:Uncharacterized protein n=1 Tax=Olsenella profusa F0195 TaxID=1125712 RepID=U2TPV6_9ACTN|nr:hypothetical protein HMPREF1316_2009 [Olsenella profusa F0195]
MGSHPAWGIRVRLVPPRIPRVTNLTPSAALLDSLGAMARQLL